MRLFILSFVISLATFTVNAQAPHAGIKIIQDGKTYLLPGKQEIQLQRKPFAIEVTLQNLDGVYLKADFTDGVYKLKNDEPVPDLSTITFKAMAEEDYNKNKELLISTDDWSYWFYDPKEAYHRFDKNVKVVNAHTYIGTKTIQQFYTSDEKTIKVQDVQSPLYLFFLTIEKGPKEVMRQKVKITWL